MMVITNKNLELDLIEQRLLAMLGYLFLGDWESWFAWYPVKDWQGEWVWMKTVNRRRIGICGSIVDNFWVYCQ